MRKPQARKLCLDEWMDRFSTIATTPVFFGDVFKKMKEEKKNNCFSSKYICRQ